MYPVHRRFRYLPFSTAEVFFSSRHSGALGGGERSVVRVVRLDLFLFVSFRLFEDIAPAVSIFVEEKFRGFVRWVLL